MKIRFLHRFAGTSRLCLVGLRGLSLLLLLTACDEKLPKPSTEGANTFACKVNGESWIPDAGGSFSGKKLNLTYYELFKPKMNLVIYATRITKKENTRIQFSGIILPGSFLSIVYLFRTSTLSILK